MLRGEGQDPFNGNTTNQFQDLKHIQAEIVQEAEVQLSYYVAICPFHSTDREEPFTLICENTLLQKI